jgi:hypothetical protein
MRIIFSAALFTAAIIGLATQYGTATQSAALSVDTVNVMELQMKADKNLPVIVTGDLV